MKDASIIICTYNRDFFLNRVLNRILEIYKLNSVDIKLEVIVVLNNCSDKSEEICKKFKRFFNDTRLKYKFIKEERQGLSYARNVGAQQSQSEWCVYLDDDGLPDTDFFLELEIAINDYRFDCFGGYYYPEFQSTPPKWLPKNFGSNNKNIYSTSVLKNSYVSGGIMAIRRKVFNDIGYFDTNLGIQGSLRIVGEETELQNRMRSKGYVIGFIPSWRMSHYTPIEKTTLRSQLRKSFLDQVSNSRIKGEEYSYIAIIKNIYIKKYAVKNILYKLILQKNYYWQNALIEYTKTILKQ